MRYDIYFSDSWKWVVSWEDMIPVTSMANMLEKCFFPKWHQVLSTWLNNNPNYEEVTNWYKGWKSMFSESLLELQLIKGRVCHFLFIHFNIFLTLSISTLGKRNLLICCKTEIIELCLVHFCLKSWL